MKPATLPGHALYFLGLPSLPSEEKAAFLGDCLQARMDENDIPAVVYRYIQIKEGENNSFNNVAFSLVVFVAIACVILTDLDLLVENKKLGILFAMIEFILLSMFLLNFGNYRSYYHSKNNSEKWLEERINEGFVRSLQEAGYDHAGFFRIKKLLIAHEFSNKVNPYLLPRKFNALSK